MCKGERGVDWLHGIWINQSKISREEEKVWVVNRECLKGIKNQMTINLIYCVRKIIFDFVCVCVCAIIKSKDHQIDRSIDLSIIISNYIKGNELERKMDSTLQMTKIATNKRGKKRWKTSEKKLLFFKFFFVFILTVYV